MDNCNVDATRGGSGDDPSITSSLIHLRSVINAARSRADQTSDGGSTGRSDTND